jgi:hypothetical protein
MDWDDQRNLPRPITTRGNKGIPVTGGKSCPVSSVNSGRAAAYHAAPRVVAATAVAQLTRPLTVG